MSSSHAEIEKRLWRVADELRANSRLKSSEYAIPVLGLIFLRYADRVFAQAQNGAAGWDRPALRLPEQARFSYLRGLPAEADTSWVINEAMRMVEAANPQLQDVLPKTYDHLDAPTLAALLDNLAPIAIDGEGDTFGNIYEYFLGKFALAEGQKGGEFFTPTAIVKLIAEIIEPYHGRIFDPACGSGGMFVQSARFVEKHRRDPGATINIYGQEKVAEHVQLCRMNLAVHGLAGDIRQGNAYYEDLHRSAGAFDFVMANPPFNVDKVDRERIANDPRYSLGLPRVGNANYLWIQIFYSALNAGGRAGFVMANSASDTRGGELAIRRKLIESGAVDAVIAIGPSFFYNATLPCMLWFLDKGKARTRRADRLLFVDARSIYWQIDRAHRGFSPAQIALLAGIVRMYRAAPVEPPAAAPPAGALDPYGETLLDPAALFPAGEYRDIAGLCKVVSQAEIAAQGWSLNPGRYVGAATPAADDGEFATRLAALHGQLAALNAEARVIEGRIADQVARLLAEEADA